MPSQVKGIVSVNLKKIKASAKVNRLLDENYRDENTAEKYDDGKRIIDTGKTKDNVFLLERPDNYDQFRKDRINRINETRAERGKMPRVSGERKRQQDAGSLRSAAAKESASTRALRSDMVDTLGIVVQFDADFLDNLTRDEQIEVFKDALEVLQDNPDWFGKVETAVIHFDENTPHMQCLSSTLNELTLTSDAQRILGNKSRYSKRQTLFADELKKKGGMWSAAFSA